MDNKGRRRIQRKVARQKLGSKSRQKTVAQLAKHTNREKIRNRNELHRITTQFVDKYDFFAIEDFVDHIPDPERSRHSGEPGSGRDN